MVQGEVVFNISGRRDLKLKKAFDGSFKIVKSFRSRAKAEFDKLATSIGGITSKVTQFGSLGFDAFNTVAGEIDEITKTAQRLGISTQALVGLQHAAEQTGPGIEVLNDGLKDMTKNLGDAKGGSKPLNDEINKLGLNISTLIKLRPEEQFKRFADAINKLPTQAERVSASTKIFGEAGAKLVNTFAVGSKGLEDFQKKAEDLNLTFSKEEAAKVEQYNDAMDNLKKTLGGTFRQFIIDVSPTAIALTKELNALLKAGLRLLRDVRRVTGSETATVDAGPGKTRTSIGNTARFRMMVDEARGTAIENERNRIRDEVRAERLARQLPKNIRDRMEFIAGGGVDSSKAQTFRPGGFGEAGPPQSEKQLKEINETLKKTLQVNMKGFDEVVDSGGLR